MLTLRIDGATVHPGRTTGCQDYICSLDGNKMNFIRSGVVQAQKTYTALAVRKNPDDLKMIPERNIEVHTFLLQGLSHCLRGIGTY